jgi:hypothetical protein
VAKSNLKKKKTIGLTLRSQQEVSLVIPTPSTPEFDRACVRTQWLVQRAKDNCREVQKLREYGPTRKKKYLQPERNDRAAKQAVES